MSVPSMMSSVSFAASLAVALVVGEALTKLTGRRAIGWPVAVVVFFLCIALSGYLMHKL